MRLVRTRVLVRGQALAHNQAVARGENKNVIKHLLLCAAAMGLSAGALALGPEERVGDAQSVLAVGRAFGPALGGVVLGADRFGALGSFSVIGVVMAAVMVEGVRRYRVANTPPSGAVGA